MYRFADNVVERSTTTTTGAYQLGGVPSGADPGARGFVAGIGDTNTCDYYAIEVGGSAWERGIGTVADAATDTLTRTAVHTSSNANAAVDWTGKTVEIMAVLPARRLATDHAGLVENLTLTTSRSGNAETIAVKTLAGTDPSATDPVRVAFAKTDGTFEVLELATALSLTISSGSTLGAASAREFKVAVLLINDAGTLRLGVAGRPSGLRDNALVSSTAEGGAGAADSARTIYTGTAVTSKRARVLGYLTYTLTTAGTWATAPSDSILTRAGATEIMACEVLYDVTLSASGVFDTNDWWPSGLPTGYDRLELHSVCRSSAAVTEDITRLWFNGDTTLTNYRRQALHADGTTVVGSIADVTSGGNIPGASSPANEFSHNIITILGPESSKTKNANLAYNNRQTATTMIVTFVSLNWESTAAINRLQLQTDNHPTDTFVSGSRLTVLGYRPMTVLM